MLRCVSCSLRAMHYRRNKTIIVRVNAFDSPHFAADLTAVAQRGVMLINLPKPRDADEVRAVAQALA